ncbi:MAG: glycosyltransferase [Candidatus Bathyarchaeota archaeon]|nr:glycosyltransferase [Candidatus Bathyarchaeota archaeon]
MNHEIGVFCPTLNVYGGGEYVALAIANTLAQHNHPVTVFSSTQIAPVEIRNFFGEPLHPKIRTIQQPTRFAPRGLLDFYQTILHSYIAKNKCTTLIDAFSNCVYPWTNVSYIHYPHLNRSAFNPQFPYLSHPRLTQAGTFPEVLLEKNLVDYSKRLVLANSNYTAEEIQRFSGKPVEVLYPPFASKIGEIGKNTTKEPQENLVVTTSRLDENKLLKRIPYIAHQTDSSIHFAVIGRLCSQNTFERLQVLVKKLNLADRVKFYPNASAEQKISLLQRAKLYLHTMVGEHFGISIVEAMALGCVPIVHDSGGMREFVPEQYRYSTIEVAAQKISSEMAAWSPEKSEEAKQIAAGFSLEKFSLRFMTLFNQYFGCN